jgi:hypothetical protein
MDPAAGFCKHGNASSVPLKLLRTALTQVTILGSCFAWGHFSNTSQSTIITHKKNVNYVLDLNMPKITALPTGTPMKMAASKHTNSGCFAVQFN